MRNKWWAWGCAVWMACAPLAAQNGCTYNILVIIRRGSLPHGVKIVFALRQTRRNVL